MPLMRVYFKGEGVERRNTSSCHILYENGHDQYVQTDANGYYVHADIHAGQCTIDPVIAKQLTKVSIEQRITDPRVCAQLRQGLYRRGSTRADVLCTRRVTTSIGHDMIEVEIDATIEISARTPKAAIRMLNDIMSANIDPTLKYGTPSKEPSASGDDMES